MTTADLHRLRETLQAANPEHMHCIRIADLLCLIEQRESLLAQVTQLLNALDATMELAIAGLPELWRAASEAEDPSR